MASKLLNVLQNIERGRFDVVKKLQHHNYEVDDDASFTEISEIIDEFQDLTNGHNEHISEEGTYYTPETDPRLYKRPEGYPNIETILKQQEDISVSEYDAYYPETILLFTMSSDALTLVHNNTTSSLSADGKLAEDTLRVGYYSGTNQVYKKLIKLSDGGEVYLDPTNNINSVTYNWDPTKDIIVGDSHLRYLIIYKHTYSTNSGSYYNSDNNKLINATGINLIECVTNNGRVDQAGAGSTSPPSAAVTMLANDLQLYKMISPHTFFSKKAHSVGGNTLSQDFYCNTLIIESSDGIPATGAWTRYPNHVVKYVSDVPASGDALWASGWGIDNYYPTIYVKVPYLPEHTVSTSVMIHWDNLEYLYITDTTVQEAIPIRLLRDLRSLRMTNLFEHIVTIGTFDAFLWNINQNIRTLDFPKLLNAPNGSFISSNSSFPPPALDAITFDSLEVKNFGFATPVLSVNMPSVKRILNTAWYDTTIKIDLSGLETLDINPNFPASLRYLDVSSLITANSLFTQNLISLKELIVADNFKYNINLTSTLLSKEKLLYIFEKAATLEEGESYTITIGATKLKLFTPEEIAIATDKGWTVN